MNQMHDIRYWLEGNLRAIEGAASSGGAGSEYPIATLLTVVAWLGLIRGATRLIQNQLYL